MSRSLGWYAQRLRRMSPAEVAWRVGDRVRHARWARRQVRPGSVFPAPTGVVAEPVFTTPLPPAQRGRVSAVAAGRLVDAADGILAGRWDVLGTARPDVADPDWFLDPVTGRYAPQDPYAFLIDHRDEEVTGNVKSVWELSRHHHLTVLAAAFWLTRDERYAENAAAQLRSWWAANPFLSGIHWTSGIELGVRLTSWVWVRRLLDDWSGAPELFEENPVALNQVRWHHEYLNAFRSRGSSANNHAVAEAVGQLAAACAFPWFDESTRWREDAAARLAAELDANTFASGVNRELASDYHRFVTELGLVALAEAGAAGHPLPHDVADLLTRSLDVAAALLDVAGHPPRQGDGDEGRALVLDGPGSDPWLELLDRGAGVLGPCRWWPPSSGSVAGITPSTSVPHHTMPRPSAAPQAFADAGLAILRSEPRPGPEIWCRCDGGPQGFLSIAAHGHADALSVEVRHDGVELLVDPGTYCYHGEPEWRSYFRSTRAHNTIEVDGQDQAVEAGPFMWSTHADAVVDRDETRPDGGGRLWSAHHTGYARLDAALCHAREVVLDPAAGTLRVTDTVTGSREHRMRLFWHLGPAVEADLADGVAVLAWRGRDGRPQQGHLHLPAALRWTAHRGETDPPLGWYSARFGERVPATTLVGTGAWTGTLDLRSELLLPASIPTTDTIDQRVGAAPRAPS